jgi:predicted CoA-binding protein
MHGYLFVLSNELEKSLDFIIDEVEIVEVFYDVDGAEEIEDKKELVNAMKEFIKSYKVGKLKMTKDKKPYVEINIDDFLKVLENETIKRIEKYIQMLEVAKKSDKPWFQLNSVASEAFELFWPYKFIFIEDGIVSEHLYEREIPDVLVYLKEQGKDKIYLTKVCDIHM